MARRRKKRSRRSRQNKCKTSYQLGSNPEDGSVRCFDMPGTKLAKENYANSRTLTMHEYAQYYFDKQAETGHRETMHHDKGDITRRALPIVSNMTQARGKQSPELADFLNAPLTKHSTHVQEEYSWDPAINERFERDQLPPDYEDEEDYILHETG